MNTTEQQILDGGDQPVYSIIVPIFSDLKRSGRCMDNPPRW